MVFDAGIRIDRIENDMRMDVPFYRRAFRLRLHILADALLQNRFAISCASSGEISLGLNDWTI